MLRAIAVALCVSSYVLLGQTMSNPQEENNHCGGVVIVDGNNTATINYKLNQEYNNNEQCVWTVRLDEYRYNALRFIKKESNFELRYDFIQLTAFDDIIGLPHLTSTLGLVHTEEVVEIEAPLVFLIFSTDQSELGTGFSLEIEAFGSSEYRYVHTDFFSDEPNGVTSLRPYVDIIQATWVITANNASTLEMGINYNTDRESDFISIFHLQRNGGRILFFPYGYLQGQGSRYYTLRNYLTFVVIFDGYNDIDNASIDLDWKQGK